MYNSDPVVENDAEGPISFSALPGHEQKILKEWVFRSMGIPKQYWEQTFRDLNESNRNPNYEVTGLPKKVFFTKHARSEWKKLLGQAVAYLEEYSIAEQDRYARTLSVSVLEKLIADGHTGVQMFTSDDGTKHAIVVTVVVNGVYKYYVYEYFPEFSTVVSGGNSDMRGTRVHYAARAKFVRVVNGYFYTRENPGVTYHSAEAAAKRVVFEPIGKSFVPWYSGNLDPVTAARAEGVARVSGAILIVGLTGGSGAPVVVLAFGWGADQALTGAKMVHRGEQADTIFVQGAKYLLGEDSKIVKWLGVGYDVAPDVLVPSAAFVARLNNIRRVKLGLEGANRAKSGWFNFRGDLGGETIAAGYGEKYTGIFSWVNRLGLRQGFSTTVRNFDAGGSWFAKIDTAVHEGFHALVGKHLPTVWKAGDATLFRIPVGAPIKYVEEVFAYAIGHGGALRFHGIPFAPLEAFGSLSRGEAITTVIFGVGGYWIYEYFND